MTKVVPPPVFQCTLLPGFIHAFLKKIPKRSFSYFVGAFVMNSRDQGIGHTHCNSRDFNHEATAAVLLAFAQT